MCWHRQCLLVNSSKLVDFVFFIGFVDTKKNIEYRTLPKLFIACASSLATQCDNIEIAVLRRMIFGLSLGLDVGWAEMCTLFICGLTLQNVEEAFLLSLPQGNIFKCNIKVIATALCYRSILVLTSEVFTVSVGWSAITLHLSTWEAL